MILTSELCRGLAGEEFELLIGSVFKKRGYFVEYTQTSGDQGVDLILTSGQERIAVQCKRYSHNVGNNAIQEVFAGMHFRKCNKAIVITNSFFTPSAIKLAHKLNVELINRNTLDKIFRETALQLGDYFYKDSFFIQTIVNSTLNLYNNKEYKKAIIILEEIISKYELIRDDDKIHAIHAFNNLGLCYSAINEHHKAINTYNEGLKLENSFILLNNKAIEYKKMRQYQMAIEIYKKINFELDEDRLKHVENQKNILEELIRCELDKSVL